MVDTAEWDFLSKCPVVMPGFEILPTRRQWSAEIHLGEWWLQSELPDIAWDVSGRGCFPELEVTFVDQIFPQNCFIHFK